MSNDKNAMLLRN